MLLKDNHVLWNYLDIEGQIIKALIEGPVKAGEIYKIVSASQPGISNKLKRLQDEGIIASRRDSVDRRVVWYELSADFSAKLLGDAIEVKSANPVTFVKKQRN